MLFMDGEGWRVHGQRSWRAWFTDAMIQFWLFVWLVLLLVAALSWVMRAY